MCSFWSYTVRISEILGHLFVFFLNFWWYPGFLHENWSSIVKKMVYIWLILLILWKLELHLLDSLEVIRIGFKSSACVSLLEVYGTRFCCTWPRNFLLFHFAFIRCAMNVNTQVGGLFPKWKRIGGRWCSSWSTSTACNTHIVEKVKQEIKKDHWKMIRNVADSTDILSTSCIKFSAEFGDEEAVFEASFECLDTGTEERKSLHCRNAFERLWGKSDASSMDHHGWWSVGFRIWSVHKVSVSAVEVKRRTTAQKSSHGSVPVKIDVNFIS